MVQPRMATWLGNQTLLYFLFLTDKIVFLCCFYYPFERKENGNKGLNLQIFKEQDLISPIENWSLSKNGKAQENCDIISLSVFLRLYLGPIMWYFFISQQHMTSTQWLVLINETTLGKAG